MLHSNTATLDEIFIVEHVLRSAQRIMYTRCACRLRQLPHVANLRGVWWTGAVYLDGAQLGDLSFLPITRVPVPCLCIACLAAGLSIKLKLPSQMFVLFLLVNGGLE